MIEELKYLLRGDQASCFMGEVLEVDEPESSGLLVRLSMLPHGNEVVAQMAFTGGLFELPEPGDIAIVTLPSDSIEYATIIALLPTELETIPERTLGAERPSSLRARPGRALHLSSDTKVTIGLGADTEEDEPLVLGEVLTNYLGELVGRLENLCDKLKSVADQTKSALNTLATTPLGSNGGGTLATTPSITTALNSAVSSLTSLGSDITSIKSGLGSDKSTYLDDADTNIKSQIAFTERGS